MIVATSLLFRPVATYLNSLYVDLPSGLFNSEEAENHFGGDCMTDPTRRENIKFLAETARLGFRRPEAVAIALPRVFNLLDSLDPEVCARSCWAVGQVGFRRPEWTQAIIPRLTTFTGSASPTVREKSIWALGRIGRAGPALVEASIPLILSCAHDLDPKVRLSVIWACENIATVRPEWFAPYVPVLMALLDDPDTRYVRGEAPEIFRVLGKRRADLVQAAIPKLTEKLTDDCRVTRIHVAGALRAIEKMQNAGKE